MLKPALAAGSLLLAPQANALDGLYAAPAPTELKAYATSPISDATWVLGADHRATLSFKVPDDLTGSEVVFLEFRELGRSAQGFIDLAGPQGRASCLTSHASLVCLIRYSRVSTDLQNVAAHLRAKYGDATALEAKMQVAQRFSSEPAGVLEIDL